MRQSPLSVAISLMAVAVPSLAMAGRPAALSVDIDCDGRPDQVFLSQTSKAASVRVAFGDPARRSSTVAFVASPARQDAVCSLPVRVKEESLDYDPTEAVGEIPGFQRSKTCKSFTLVDDRCDSIHFYWNHKTRRLEWWRL